MGCGMRGQQVEAEDRSLMEFRFGPGDEGGE